MLPTSHTAPRNGTGTGLLDAPSDTFVDVLLDTPEPAAGGEAILLATAFSEFIAAAGRLEASYGELQGQVAELGRELAQRNAALNASLAENEGMRVALQQIVDSMPCGVLVLEKDGALSMINPEGMRLLEVNASEARSLDAISAHTGIDLAAFVAAFVEDQGLFECEQEFSLALHAGKRWIEVRRRRIHAAAEDAGRYQTILILRDVTAHKLAEQERERARKATALAEVAAMLAHEIRNPLASMELFAGLIAGSESVVSSNGPELVWISHMRAGIRSLSGTVNNVLNIHGADFPALAALDLGLAIERSIEFARPIAEQAGVALEFHAESRGARSSGIQVLGNASALQQLVLNLVSNAVRHTARGGCLRVTIRAADSARACECRPNVQPGPGTGKRVLVEFADNGSGIREEHLAKIFRAGFSASGHTSGLGLAVCRQIVRQHEGDMRVTSELGKGTTFCVELPIL